ncbi:hypothetical protein FKM82_021350 [Ascaphus truei]
MQRKLQNGRCGDQTHGRGIIIPTTALSSKQATRSRVVTGEGSSAD